MTTNTYAATPHYLLLARVCTYLERAAYGGGDLVEGFVAEREADEHDVLGDEHRLYDARQGLFAWVGGKRRHSPHMTGHTPHCAATLRAYGPAGLDLPLTGLRRNDFSRPEPCRCRTARLTSMQVPGGGGHREAGDGRLWHALPEATCAATRPSGRRGWGGPPECARAAEICRDPKPCAASNRASKRWWHGQGYGTPKAVAPRL